MLDVRKTRSNDSLILQMSGRAVRVRRLGDAFAGPGQDPPEAAEPADGAAERQRLRCGEPVIDEQSRCPTGGICRVTSSLCPHCGFGISSCHVCCASSPFDSEVWTSRTLHGPLRKRLPPPFCQTQRHLTEHTTGVSQNPRRSEDTPMADQLRRQSVDRHEPAPVCEPSVLEASRAITFNHLHKPPDPELGEDTSSFCSGHG